MKHFSSPILLVLLVACTITTQQQTSFAQKAPNHGLWNQVLMKHVTSNGKVNYKGIKSDLNFKKYLAILEDKRNAPNESWSEKDKLAYWINIYNAYTVKLIIDNYPLKSIKDIGTSTKGPWDIKFIKLGDQTYCLGDVEHEILRKKFNEPRIHFAIVCASYSCPNLRNEAFFPEKIEQQLQDQAEKFVNNTLKNKITAEKAELSKIFSWFKGDFTKDGKLYEFINKYSKVKITSKTKISFLEYGWQLNE